jgi:hypothetical protein
MPAPKQLEEQWQREMARRIRDWHWEVMERLAREGVVNVCLWNKYHQDERPDEMRMCLISGGELMEWVRAHRSWFRVGRKHNDERHTFPLSLTKAGRDALRHRERYDMEPVLGGLVEPGWSATPAPPATV